MFGQSGCTCLPPQHVGAKQSALKSGKLLTDWFLNAIRAKRALPDVRRRLHLLLVILLGEAATTPTLGGSFSGST